MVLIYVSLNHCYEGYTMNSWATPNPKWALLWSPSQVFSCHHTSWSVHSSVPFELLEIPSTKNHTATPVGSEVFVFGVLVNQKNGWLIGSTSEPSLLGFLSFHQWLFLLGGTPNPEMLLCEPRKKIPSYFPVYWLSYRSNRDPEISLLKSPLNWVL